MSASEILQYLYSLDTSSPDFLRVLYGLIRHDEDEQYSSSLEGEELARLVDFLDDVCPLPQFFVPIQTGLRRPSVLFLPQMTSSDNVYANCEPSAATTRLCHLRTSYVATSPELVKVRLLSADLPTCGMGPTAAGESVSRR